MAEFELTPHQLLRIISRDLARYMRNSGLKQLQKEYKQSGANPRKAGSAEPTAILKNHLLGCKNEAEVLRKMCADRWAGLRSHKKEDRWTYMIYDNEALLKESKTIAEQYYGKEANDKKA